MISAVLLLLAARASSAQEPKPVEAAVARPLVAEKRWALVVGAGAYEKLSPLKYAPADAAAFAGVLKDGYGFAPSTLGLLSDTAERKPTSANILGELDRLLGDKRLDRGDLFVFYFSGHGIGTASGDYLMPTDVAEADAPTKGVPVRQVIERFTKAGLKNVLVVADACRSGKANPFGAELQDLGRKANIAVLLGCAPGERSYEYPQLGKGVFTHFLVRAMEDRRLTDPASGALWASAVARKVQAQVKGYTEADYGEDAQVPAVWTEPTQDVLLGAYPPKDEAVRTALASAGAEFKDGTLDRERYGRYLAATGRSLEDSGRSVEAIGALKTLDGLGLATWRDLNALAESLSGEDRDNEVGSLVARAVREPSPTDHTELVILHGEPVYVGIERYRKAMQVVTDPQTYGFQGARIFAVLARYRLRMEEDEIARELKAYVPLVAPDSMAARYLGASIALGEGRPAEALSLAEAAAAMPAAREERTVDELRRIRFRAATRLGDAAKIEAIIAEGEADPKDTFPWAATRLHRLEEAGDPKAREALMAFAAKTDSDARMNELIMRLGIDAGVLLPDAERLAAAHPYSWEASVNAWLARSAAKGLTVVPRLPDAAFKYAPSRSDLVRSALNRWDDLLQSAQDAGRVDDEFAAYKRDQLVGWYAEFWDDVKDEPVALFGMGRMLMRSAQSVRGVYFAKEVLWPLAQKQDYVRQELMSVSLFLALNGADEALATEIFDTLDRERLLGPRAILRYAMHQGLIGNAAEAERAMGRYPSLGLGEPGKALAGDFLVIRALLAAKAGDGAKAKALIGSIEGLTRDFALLGWLARYEADGRRGLSEEIVPLLLKPNAEFSDLQVAATVAAIEGHAARVAAGDATEATRSILKNVSILLCDYPAHPWTRAVAFQGQSGAGQYVGRTEWKGWLSDGVSNEDLTARIDINAKGEVQGFIDFPVEKMRWTVEGEIDERGNLGADVFMKRGEIFGILATKMPPREVAAGEVANGTHFKVLLLNSPWKAAQLSLIPTKTMTAAQVLAELKTAPVKKVPAKKAPVKKVPAKKAPVKKPVKKPGQR